MLGNSSAREQRFRRSRRSRAGGRIPTGPCGAAMLLRGPLMNQFRSGGFTEEEGFLSHSPHLGLMCSFIFLGTPALPLPQHLTDSSPEGPTMTSSHLSAHLLSPIPPPAFSSDNNEAENVAGKGIDLFISHLLIKSFLPPVKIPMISFAESNGSVLRA